MPFDEKQSELFWYAVKVSLRYLFRVLLVGICFADRSTLIGSYLLQTNTSMKTLLLREDFVLEPPNKWMSMALQVRD